MTFFLDDDEVCILCTCPDTWDCPYCIYDCIYECEYCLDCRDNEILPSDS